MRIIYTKEEVQKVMRKHYKDTHYGTDADRPIVEMTMSPSQIHIEIGYPPIPNPSKEEALEIKAEPADE